ncbi:Ig-like domain-containing protein [Fodinibius halophilus]|uniref:Uncharacterized protein n=1 Tax=Fodinibius halophilus TaxID=1736908 RepID=A0A6M1SY82_9BACT|nr:Ig-like domain-containing protein [Fodinibius halophilus]NGP88356.1 hypothetical protein [Fodinibius halophilus]
MSSKKTGLIRWIRWFIILLLVGSVGCKDSSPTGGGSGDDSDPPEEEYAASFTDEEAEFAPGELVRVYIEGSSLNSERYEGTIDEDVGIELVKYSTDESDNMLLMAVPELSEEDHKLQFALDEQSLELSFSVVEYSSIDDPAQYVDNYITDLQQFAAKQVEQAGSEEEASWARDMENDLSTIAEQTTNLEASQLRKLAYLVQANLAGQQLEDPQGCSEYRGIIIQLAEWIEYRLGIVVSLALENNLPEWDLQEDSAPTVLSVATYARKVTEARSAFGAALESCIQDPVNRLVFAGKIKQEPLTYAELAETQQFDFYHSQPERFRVESSYVPPQDLLEAVSEFVEKQGELTELLPANYLDLLVQPPEEVTQQRNPANFSIENVSLSSVEAAAQFEGDELLLGFAYKQGQMPEQGQAFTFELTDGDHPEATVQIEGYLETGDVDITTEFVSSEPRFLPGELSQIRVEGAALSKESYSGIINGEHEARLVPVQENGQDRLTFLVPELPEGEHTLQVRLAGLKQSLEFTVKSYEPISDPEQFTTDIMDKVDSQLKTIQEQVGDQVVADRIQQARDELANGRSKFGNLTEQEQQNIAYFINTNLDAFTDVVSGKRAKNGIDERRCNELRNRVVRWKIAVIGSIGGITASAELGIFQAAGAAVLGGVSIGSLLISLERLLEVRDQLLNKCAYKIGSDILAELSGQSKKQKKVGSIGTSTSGTGLTFTHKQSKSFQVKTPFDMPQDIKQLLNEVREALNGLFSYLPESWTDKISLDQFSYEAVRDPAEFSLQNISKSSIEGTLKTDGDHIELTFSYKQGQMPATAQSFTFELHDSEYPEAPTTFEATLIPVNLPNVADQQITINKNESYQGELTGEFTDRFEIVQTVQYGELTLDDAQAGNFTYTPAQDLVTKEGNPDSFTYRGINGNGADTAQVTIQVKDLSPVAYDDQFTVEMNSYYEGTLLADFVEEFVIVEYPDDGKVDMNQVNGDFRYTPDQDYHGKDRFTFKAVNKVGESDVAEVNIQVNATPPVAAGDTLTIKYDTRLDGQLKVPGATRYEIVDNPINGKISTFDEQTGEFRYYRPYEWRDGTNYYDHFTGQDEFSFKAFNKFGASEEATIVINVELPDLPVARDDEFTIEINDGYTDSFKTENTRGFMDFEIIEHPAMGSADINNGGFRSSKFTYDPLRSPRPALYLENDSFTYRVRNVAGWSNTATVNINMIYNYELPENCFAEPGDFYAGGRFTDKRQIQAIRCNDSEGRLIRQEILNDESSTKGWRYLITTMKYQDNGMATLKEIQLYDEVEDIERSTIQILEDWVIKDDVVHKDDGYFESTDVYETQSGNPFPEFDFETDSYLYQIHQYEGMR